jgi:DNA-directed RNA polymerase specialized sigma24 family protein
LNTPPQVDGLIGLLSGPFPAASGVSGPSWPSGKAGEFIVEDTAERVPRPLHRRLSHDQRAALIAAFASGIKQRDLAAQYGISIRSIKRLVRAARGTG